MSEEIDKNETELENLRKWMLLNQMDTRPRAIQPLLNYEFNEIHG